MFRLFFIAFSLVSFLSKAQVSLDYYFTVANINSDIPTPKSILGFEVGEKHVSHDQLVNYMHVLAKSSDRINIEEYGRTYENRPLLLLSISSPQNIKDIEKIRTKHLELTNPSVSQQVSIDNLPSVVWMGYSVHGNEPSGANASLLVAYFLAASESAEILEILTNTVILIDPSINPDGLSRFSQWVNQFHSKTVMADPNNLEQNEPWPGGRTNHYWFDLNRDWLLVQHPESQGRIEKFHEWKPNILTDHHEMGSNSTFFFQPGIPSRNNPITPGKVYELTDKLGEYFAAGMDKIGSLYYARESFDDFYYGKGSTYPDINGGVGILFEQASSRGHIRETDNGLLTFPFTIRNQFAASLSTIKAGSDLRMEFLEHQRTFYKEGLNLADKNVIKAYVFDDDDDEGKLFEFLKILDQHQIETYHLNSPISIQSHNYKTSHAYIVPLKQKQYRLIKTIFEKNLEFKDSLFYDVSAWTLPLAFDMNYSEISEKQYKTSLIGELVEKNELKPGMVSSKSTYAYLFKWNDYYAAKALYKLQEKKIKVKVAEKSFDINSNHFEPGTILIPVQGQSLNAEDLFQAIELIAGSTGIDFYPVETGYTSSGINLGSPYVTSLEKPEILLLVDEGVSSYEAGEIWHLLDNRFEIPVSLVSIEVFNEANLERYNTLIMASGSYNGITENGKENLHDWLSKGGKIIAIKSASRWLSNQKIAQIEFKTAGSDSISTWSYKEMPRFTGAQAIGGSIFEATLDTSHPLCYGYPDNKISLFKNGKYFFKPSKNSYNNPVLYTSNPLQSGYISNSNHDLIKNSSAVVVSSEGQGKIICFSDDPNFRAFWYGTNRLFLNAVFFGDIISSQSTR